MSWWETALVLPTGSATLGDSVMYFSVGGHPAFKLPLTWKPYITMIIILNSTSRNVQAGGPFQKTG